MGLYANFGVQMGRKNIHLYLPGFMCGKLEKFITSENASLCEAGEDGEGGRGRLSVPWGLCTFCFSFGNV